MNKEAQRIAIGEACGWEEMSWVDAGYWIKDHKVTKGLPDYLNDLNAMHIAELLILDDEDNWNKYWSNLMEICDFCDEVLMIHIPASQRAEAFLKTIGKWVEDSQITTNSNAPKDVGGHNSK